MIGEYIFFCYTRNNMELVVEQPSLGRVGFHNEGNSCFLSAACQVRNMSVN